MRSKLLRLSALLCALASCSGGGATTTLRLAMLEVEKERVNVERALLSTDGLETVVAATERLQGWLGREPVIQQYFERADLAGTRAQFDRLLEAFQPKVQALHDAASAGDAAGAREAYLELSQACNACHGVFRPDLAPR